jgi:uncharacterized membrane protein YqjE
MDRAPLSVTDAAAGRVAVFASELRDEARRGSEGLVIGVAAFAFVHLALLMAAAAVVMAFWDTHRIAATLAVGLLYAGAGIACVLRLRTLCGEMSRGFAGTRASLRKDIATLRALRSQLESRRAAASTTMAWLARGIAVARFTRSIAQLFSRRVRDRTDAKR